MAPIAAFHPDKSAEMQSQKSMELESDGDGKGRKASVHKFQEQEEGDWVSRTSQRIPRDGVPVAKKSANRTMAKDNIGGVYQSSQGYSSENDPNNTTVFVGGLDSNVDEEYLRQIFTPYGEISYVKIPVGKHCGFVQLISRSCAEEAIQMLNGSQIGAQKVRLSWGGTPQNRQASQQDANSQYNGNSYYGYQQQGYEGYGYAAPNTQDPSMQNYYGYPGYGNYEQQQQQPPPALEQQQQPPPPQQ